MIGQFIDDFEEQLGYVKYSVLPLVHRGEINDLINIADTKLQTELNTLNNKSFYSINKNNAYIRFVLGYCTYLYLTVGSESMSREFILEKLRIVSKATTNLLTLNWKLEAKLHDILSAYTLDLCHVAKSAFFNTNVW